jgi:hypothetical protein
MSVDLKELEKAPRRLIPSLSSTINRTRITSSLSGLSAVARLASPGCCCSARVCLGYQLDQAVIGVQPVQVV